MSRAFKTAIDLEKNEVLNLRLHQLSSPPTSPVVGQCYYNTTDDLPYVWDGAAWLAMVGSGTPDAGWTVLNPSTDKTLDVAKTSPNEMARVLGTLIDALKAKGILS
jgi:hypothetical protein